MSNPELVVSKYIKQLIVREDNMSASIVVDEPPRTEISRVKQDIVRLLVNQGISYGVLDQSIDMLFEHKLYNQEVEVARGISVVPGSDGRLVRTPQLQTEKKLGVNLSPDLAVEGDTLFELVAPTQGSHGINLYGIVTFAIPGKQADIKFGPGVALTEDGIRVVALKAGFLKQESGLVDVIDDYLVEGSVNRFTGNIHFPGNVHVRGDVSEGYEITAEGNVVVDGLVDSATIIAGKNITILKGLIGGNRAILSAKEDIYVDFIENAVSVEAGRTIYCNLILNSNLYAMDSIVVENDGQIIGGRAVAHNRIECKIAGFKSFVSTELVVGIAPERLQLMEETENLIKELKSSNNEVRKDIVFLEGKLAMKTASNLEVNSIQDTLREYVMTFSYNNSVLDELNERLASLKNEVNSIAKIMVSDLIYPMTKVKVNHMELLIQEHMKHRCIYSDEEEILIIDLDDCVV